MDRQLGAPVEVLRCAGERARLGLVHQASEDRVHRAGQLVMTFRLTAPVALEDELHLSMADALDVVLPSDAVWTTWELRNAASAAEGARRKRLRARAGWPDAGVFWRGRVVLVELKRSRYGALSPAQRALHPRLADTGFPVAVCRSVSEVLDAVAAAGVPVRGRVAA
jgi:hypothetical protein